MFKKKLISLGLAVLITVSSVSTSVFAMESRNFNNGKSAGKTQQKFFTPENKDKKSESHKYKFKDSGDVKWALNAIEKLAAKGILAGKTADSFKPKDQLSKLEALAMVLKLLGDGKEAESKSNLIHPLYKGNKLPWGLGYIFLAIEKKILLPEELSEFNPSSPAKRHEVARYIIRALGKTDEALKHMDEDLSFKDEKAIPKASVGYVYLANKLELMTGDDRNEFKPMNTITRAEMAVILDRADGKTDLPDSDIRKSNVRFVSYNDDTDTITVLSRNTRLNYKVYSNAPVFVDSGFKSTDDLEAGDILRLVFNQSKQVIFIEVVGHSDADDDDDNDSDTEEDELDIDTMDYDDLPEILQEQVDYLKLSKNYKAYEYEGDIYLIATRGKKSTGGYEIDITEAFKVTLGDNKYNIKAVVETEDPSDDDNVTQAIAYPYSVVKLDDFSGIQKVVFVDDDNSKLAEAAVADLDEVVEVDGAIQVIYSDDSKIKVLKENGSTAIYPIPDSADIEVNNENADFEDLKVNMKVTLELHDEKVTKVEAEDTVTEIECILSGINMASSKTITVKVGSTYKTYSVESSTDIIIDDKDAELQELTIGSEVTLTFENGVLTKIEKE